MVNLPSQILGLMFAFLCLSCSLMFSNNLHSSTTCFIGNDHFISHHGHSDHLYWVVPWLFFFQLNIGFPDSIFNVSLGMYVLIFLSFSFSSSIVMNPYVSLK